MFHHVAVSLSLLVLGGCAQSSVEPVQYQNYTVTPQQRRPPEAQKQSPRPGHEEVARQLSDIDRALEAAQRTIDEHARQARERGKQ